MEGNSKITPAEDIAIKHGFDPKRFHYTYIVTAIKEAQKQAETVGFNKGLELAAEKAGTRTNDEITSIIVDKQSILTLKHSDELK